MANISSIKLPSGNTYDIKDNSAMPISGGTFTGPVTFGDSMTAPDANVGDLVVTGAASFTNNAQLKDTLISGDLRVTGNYNGAFYYVEGTAGTNNGDWIAYLSEVAIPYTGLKLAYKIPKAGNSSSTARTLTNDDGTTVSATYTWLKFNGKWYKCYYAASDALTTHYNTVNSVVELIFDQTLNSNAGGFRAFADYNSNTTNAYGYLDYYFRPYAGSAIYRYKFCALDKDNRLQPMVITNQENTTQVTKTPNSVSVRPYKIWYYNTTTTISAGSVVGAQTLNAAMYGGVCAYNFNAAIPAYRLVYYVGTYNKTTDLFTLEQTTTGYYVSVPTNTANITLSSYFTSGKYYWLVGGTYSSADNISIFANNPLYYFDGTNLVPVRGGATSAASATTGITASTTATKTTLGTAFTIPNVTSAGSASTWTFEEKSIPNVTSAGSASTWAFTEVSIPNVTSAGSASTWTFEEKSIPNVTAAGSGSFTSGAFSGGSGSFSATVSNHILSFSHTHTAATHGADSHTHTAPTIGTAIKVQSKSGGANGSAPTLGTAIKVQSKSSGSNGTAPTLGTAIKVQSKSGGANGSAPTLGTAFTVPNVTGNTSATVSITDNGHTHTLS